MNFEEFCFYVKKEMELKYPESKVLMNDIIKDNDIMYKGISIIESEKSIQTSPCIYLNEFYNEFLKEKNLDEILYKIVYVNENNKKNLNISLNDFDLNKIKNNIFLKALNTEKNLQKLNNKIFFNENDLSFVFYIRISMSENGFGMVLITNELFQSFQISIDELKEIAIQNMMHEIDFRPIGDVINEVNDDCNFEMDESQFVPMYVLTNKSKVNGAGYLGIEQCMKQFRKKISNFYILPSSIHEILLIPDLENETIHVNELREMVQVVNQTQVSEEEFLSNNIYYYSAKTGKIEIA